MKRNDLQRNETPQAGPRVTNVGRMLCRHFALCLQRYRKRPREVRKLIAEAAAVAVNPAAPDEDREAAAETMAELLFPSGVRGVLSEGWGVTFTERVQTVLCSRGLRQRDLADALGVKHHTVTMMLKRKGRPLPQTVRRVAAALGVPPEQLWPELLRTERPVC